MIWGDAERRFKPPRTSSNRERYAPVVAAGEGYYILKRLKVYSSGYYASMQPGVLRERVTSKIRERKEQVRAAQFVDDVLNDKLGRSLPAPFKLLAMSMLDVFKDHAHDSLITLTPEILSELKARVG